VQSGSCRSSRGSRCSVRGRRAARCRARARRRAAGSRWRVSCIRASSVRSWSTITKLRCCHDGDANDTRAHEHGLPHHRAYLVVTRRAPLRPRAPKALAVASRALLHNASAWFCEGFGSRQEVVVALSHDFSPSSRRLITLPTPCHGCRSAERSRRKSPARCVRRNCAVRVAALA
jgi:hypothetical protein